VASCQQIESLIQAYIDGELSTAERVVLERHTDGCAACAGRVEEQRASAALLFESLGAARLNDDLSGSIMAHLPEMDVSTTAMTVRAREVNYRVKNKRSRTARLSRLSRWVPVFVPIVLGVVAVTLFLAWPDNVTMPANTVGMVTFEDGRVLSSEGATAARDRVHLEDTVIRDTWFETENDAKLVLSLTDRSTVKVAADTLMRVHNGRRIDLSRGRIWLEVGKADRYFRVGTPSGDITVFGTIFDVEVKDGNTTVVTVSEGEVHVDNGDAFTVLSENQQVALTVGAKPLRPVKVNARLVSAWSDRFEPNVDSEAMFASATRGLGTQRVRADQYWVVDARKRDVQAITFEWQPSAMTAGRCDYDVFVSDEKMNPLFKARISDSAFARRSRTYYEIAIPGYVNLGSVKNLHIRLVPDRTTGTVETQFVEVAALGI